MMCRSIQQQSKAMVICRRRGAFLSNAAIVRDVEYGKDNSTYCCIQRQVNNIQMSLNTYDD